MIKQQDTLSSENKNLISNKQEDCNISNISTNSQWNLNCFF